MLYPKKKTKKKQRFPCARYCNRGDFRSAISYYTQGKRRSAYVHHAGINLAVYCTRAPTTASNSAWNLIEINCVACLRY